MRHLQLFWILFLSSILLVWCNFTSTNQTDTTNSYQEAKKICKEHEWKITTDEQWTSICLFPSKDWCQITTIEDWSCEYLNPETGWERITVATDLCNEQWWEVQHREEWWEDFEICMFKDESFCYLNDLAAWSCEKWDMRYYDEEDDDRDDIDND